MKEYTCPCCGYKTLKERPPGSYQICDLCFWEDDGVQFDDPFYRGGANSPSLYEAQLNYIHFGVSDTRFKNMVRALNDRDVKDTEWEQVIYEDNRPDNTTLELDRIKTSDEFIDLIVSKLCFKVLSIEEQEILGERIICVGKLSKYITLSGWREFRNSLPREAEKFLRYVQEYNEENPYYRTRVLPK